MSQQKKTKADKKQGDGYAAVLICQIITAIILFVLFSVLIKPYEALNSIVTKYICEEKLNISSVVTAVGDYFSSENNWQVFSHNAPTGESSLNDDISPSTSDSAGRGGDDIELFRAEENTSFAPLRVTATILSPIEDGRYTSFFGYRINPITNKFSFHTGLDIAAGEGTKIRAAYNGTVLRTGEDDRSGKYILLSHDDGFITFYCHCSEILAPMGARLRQGETIALVGSTGWSTGPHLHFEVRKDNIRYNPLPLIENEI